MLAHWTLPRTGPPFLPSAGLASRASGFHSLFLLPRESGRRGEQGTLAGGERHIAVIVLRVMRTACGQLSRPRAVTSHRKAHQEMELSMMGQGKQITVNANITNPINERNEKKNNLK
ncbi:hypothetical protein E2C01_081333 [Portunus trituberculatus]|uniref:Uncharacterized protein n=1 Tax=Portunus trituberculatus TaxID=210409 RepID=A0A5B7IW14_PORTR|nr:hypothetical protein [Portunus trituberculatus]